MTSFWGMLHPDARLLERRPGPTAIDTPAYLGGPGTVGWSASLGPLQLLLTGRPHWQESSIAALAARENPATALLNDWQACGEQSLRKIQQGFALALWDGETLVLAVDPMGLETLAFARSNRTWLWHSRTDQLARLIGKGVRLQGVFDYLHAHMVPSPGSIWEGVTKLTPGSLVRVRADQHQIETWWQPAWREPVTAPALAASAEQLRLLLRNAVDRNLAGEAAAAFLSGGLDSSSVVSLASQLRPGAVRAFGIGFHAEGYDEMAFAEASATHAGATLHKYYVTPEDVLQALPKVAGAYDEPFGNASAVPAYFCAREAANQGYSHLLAGDGGDELFGGNARYAKQLWFEPYQQLPVVLRRLLSAACVDTPFSRLPLFSKLASYIRQANVPLPDRLETWNFLHRQALSEIFTSDFLAHIDAEAPLKAQRARYQEPSTASTIKRMLHLDLKFTLADNDLRKVNRMAELAGVRVSYPMLDLAVIDFAAGLPSDWLVRHGELRWFYRRAFQPLLSPSTLNKRKHGFGLPFGLWMQEHAGLKALAVTRLQALKRRGWFQAAWLDELINERAAAHADYYGVMIWVLSLLEEWLESQGQ